MILKLRSQLVRFSYKASLPNGFANGYRDRAFGKMRRGIANMRTADPELGEEKVRKPEFQKCENPFVAAIGIQYLFSRQTRGFMIRNKSAKAAVRVTCVNATMDVQRRSLGKLLQA